MRCGSSGGSRQLLLLAAALAAAAALLTGVAGGNPNPYAGKSYGSCLGNYCPSADDALELEFWRAADSGDTAAVKVLLGNPSLNLTRNIVPDDDGLTRVLDVAVWAASEKGHLGVMETLLSLPDIDLWYAFEDGHILDLAAAKGDVKMVQLLLKHNMTVGPSAMAHAAHFNHTSVMKLLLAKPTDLKSAMQAISNGGSPEVARLLLEANKKSAAAAEEQSQGAYDWHADYVKIAVQSGNMPVLKVLLAEGWVLKWQQAEDFIKIAAAAGSRDVLGVLLDQQLFKDDAEELEEAVQTALKTAAENGKGEVVDLLLKRHPKQTQAHCKAGVFRAMKYGHADIVSKLTASGCSVDVSKSAKLQAAEWLGQLLNGARSGDAAALTQLLKHKKAAAWVRKLQTPVDEDAASDKQAPPAGPLIPTQHDPLVIAAVAGHLDAVKVLEGTELLCPPCAAAEAARHNHTAVVQHLASGTAKVMMQNREDVIQDALRVLAYSMEKQNWGLVSWLLAHHDSRELGPYFLPAIAQEAKLDDMNRMLALLGELGVDQSPYFKQQVHSALISAALSGHLDLVLALKKHSTPAAEALVRAAAGALADEDDAGGSKSEL